MDYESFSFLLADISSASIVLPIALSLRRFNKLEKRLQILSLYLYIFAAFEAFVIYLAVKGINNMPLQHIFTPVQFSFLSIIYYLSFHHLFIRRLIIVLAIIIFLFTVVNAVLIQSIYEFNSNSSGLAGILVIIFTVIYFYQTFKETVIVKLENHPMFWINSGWLIYFSWNILLFIFYNKNILSTTEFYLQYWSIHSVFYILLNLLIAVGLWVGQRK